LTTTERIARGSPGTLAKTYLVAYNVFSAAGWTLVLYRTLLHLFALSPAASAKATSGAGAGGASAFLASLKPNSLPPLVWVPSILPAHLVPFYRRACTTYDAVGETTAIVQSAAVLEIVHVIFGLVRSPLPTTAVQVASRLFSVWCLANEFPSVRPSQNIYLKKEETNLTYLFISLFFCPFLTFCFVRG
jgi:very-long-chain (3R)-3-hydroxyacyl-CoA dehydratase